MRQHLRLGRLHSHHRAALRQRLHQPPTSSHQSTRVRQREHTRHMRGRHLTDRMTGNKLRPHTPRLDQPEQRHLDREETGLRVRRPVQHRRVVAPDHLTQRALQVLVESGADRVERLREHRETLVQTTPHPQTLRPLPREQERGAAGLDGAEDDGGVRLTDADGREATDGGLAVVRQDHGAVVEEGTLRGQGERQVHGAQAGVALDLGQQPRGLGAQCLLGTARQDPRHDAGGEGGDPVPAGLGFRDRLGLFEDDVGVGAADPERGHAGPAQPLLPRPHPLTGQQLHSTGGPVDVRRRSIHVQRARQPAVTHRHHHLDDTRDTRRSLRVAEVRLHRTEPERPALLTLLPVRGQERLRLDRVTQRRPGAMGLHDVHVSGRQTTARQSLADDTLLGGTVGRRQTVRRTVLVHRRPTHHRQYTMTVAPGVGETLQHHHAHALGPAHTISRVRERTAPPVRRQTTLTRELHERRRRRHHRHTTGHRQRALTRTQRLRRPVQRHQRRRARRVHRHRRTLEPERVRDTAGRDAGCAAVAAEALIPLVGEHVAVVVVHDTGEDARLAAAQGGRVDTGPLDRLPRRLQEQTLLGVGRHRLARAHPEELGVEGSGVVQEATGLGVGGTGRVPVGVVERVDVPASVDGELGDGVDALGDDGPEVLRRGDTARVAAGHAHDHDRVLGHRRQRRHRHDRRRLHPAEQLLQQVPHQRVDRRIVEHHRRRQPQSRRLPQPVPQLHRGQRIKTQILKRTPRIHRLHTRMPQHHRNLTTHQIQQHLTTLIPTQRPKTLHQTRRRHRTTRSRTTTTPPHQTEHHRVQVTLPPQGGQVEPDREDDRLTGGQGRVEERGPLLGGQLGHACAGDAVPAGPGEGADHAGVLGPRAPGERGRGQAEAAAVAYQGVEEGVAGRVVGLAGAAEDAGHRGEEDEGFEVEGAGGLVQVPRGVRLRAQHAGHALGRE